MDLREVQEVLLSLMVKTHLYCEEKNLLYSIAYGTLLGAARHKGFIPWDNDIDIMMPRADFEKLLELTRRDPIAKDVGVLHYTTDSRYHYNVIRIYDKNTTISIPYVREYPEGTGLWLDIFPLDPYSTSIRYIPTRLGLAFNKVLQRANLYAFARGHGWKRTVLYVCHRLFPDKNNKHARQIDRYAQSCSIKDAECLSDTIERGAVHTFCPKDQFESLTLLEFEGVQLYAPKDFEAVLTKTYGSTWTELPPEDKRQTHDIIVERSNSLLQ